MFSSSQDSQDNESSIYASIVSEIVKINTKIDVTTKGLLVNALRMH